MVRSPQISNSQMCLHEPSAIHRLEFRFCTLALVSAAVPTLSLCSSNEQWLFACLSSLGSHSLPCVPLLFQSVQLFTCQDKVVTFRFLTFRTRNFDFFLIGKKRVSVTYFLGKMYLPLVIKMKSGVLQKKKTLYALMN